MIVAMARTTTPRGFRPCDGTLVTLAQFPRLYAAIGGTHDADYTARTGLTVPSGSFALPYLQDRLPLGAEAASPAGTAANAANHTHAFSTSIAPSANTTNVVTGGAHFHNFPTDGAGFIGYINSSGSHDHTWGRDYGPVYNVSDNTSNKPNARGAGTDNTYATARGSHSHSVPTNYAAGAAGSHGHAWTSGYVNNSGNHNHNVATTNSSHSVTGGNLPRRFTARYLIRVD